MMPLSLVKIDSRTTIALAWILAGAALLVFFVRWLDALTQPFNVFPAYYTAARMILNGESVALFYDAPWFRERVMDFAPGRLESYNANTPFLAFFFLPLANLPYEVARHITSSIGFVALVASTYLVVTELRITGAWRAAAFFAVFVAPASLINLALAQLYPIVLLMMVLAWIAWRRGAEALGGSLLGLALAFKTAGIFMVLLMLLERRWRALAAAAAVVVAFALATFPIVGYEGWEAYINRARALSGSMGLAFGGYLAVPGFALNLFQYDARLNPDPYFNAPILAQGIEVLAFVGFVTVAAAATLRTQDRDVPFALFIMVSLILVPVTANTHTVLAYLPALIIFDRLRDRLSSPLGIWFLIGGILAFAPIIERSRALLDQLGPIVYYPRLFGLVALTIVCLVLALEKRAAPASRPTVAPA